MNTKLATVPPTATATNEPVGMQRKLSQLTTGEVEGYGEREGRTGVRLMVADQEREAVTLAGLRVGDVLGVGQYADWDLEHVASHAPLFTRHRLPDRQQYLTPLQVEKLSTHTEPEQAPYA